MPLAQFQPEFGWGAARAWVVGEDVSPTPAAFSNVGLGEERGRRAAAFRPGRNLVHADVGRGAAAACNEAAFGERAPGTSFEASFYGIPQESKAESWGWRRAWFSADPEV